MSLRNPIFFFCAHYKEDRGSFRRMSPPLCSHPCLKKMFNVINHASCKREEWRKGRRNRNDLWGFPLNLFSHYHHLLSCLWACLTLLHPHERKCLHLGVRPHVFLTLLHPSPKGTWDGSEEKTKTLSLSPLFHVLRWKIRTIGNDKKNLIESCGDPSINPRSVCIPFGSFPSSRRFTFWSGAFDSAWIPLEILLVLVE